MKELKCNNPECMAIFEASMIQDGLYFIGNYNYCISCGKELKE
jgi:hypothetical protein